MDGTDGPDGRTGRTVQTDETDGTDGRAHVGGTSANTTQDERGLVPHGPMSKITQPNLTTGRL